MECLQDTTQVYLVETSLTKHADAAIIRKINFVKEATIKMGRSVGQNGIEIEDKRCSRVHTELTLHQIGEATERSSYILSITARGKNPLCICKLYSIPYSDLIVSRKGNAEPTLLTQGNNTVITIGDAFMLQPSSETKFTLQYATNSNEKKRKEGDDEILLNKQSPPKKAKCDDNLEAKQNEEEGFGLPVLWSPKKSPNKKPAFVVHSPPPKKGKVAIPEGKKGCLTGLVFVITGVMESLEREEVTELIKKYGGRVISSVSKSLTHAVVGLEAGPKKMEQLQKFPHIQIINEAKLLEMIKTLPGAKDGAKDAVEQEKNLYVCPMCKFAFLTRNELMEHAADCSPLKPKGKQKMDVASPDRPLRECKYGDKCYRKNPEHFKEFSHPAKNANKDGQMKDDLGT